MSALTSLLVRDQRVPVRKVEEAIQRQVIAGGRLDTVLLELGLVPENVLNAYLAATHGLLPATRDEVMRVPRDVVRLVPREIAVKHRLVPVSAEERVLVVAVTEPLEEAVEAQLGFLLGLELVQRVVNECRLAAALHHHYDVEMPARIRRLVERLRHEAPGAVPYVAPLEVNVAERAPVDEDDYTSGDDDTSEDDEGAEEDEAPASTKRFGVVAEEAAPAEVVRVGAAQVVGVRSAPPPRRSGAPEGPRRPRRIAEPRAELLARMRGPLTTRKAVELLADAPDRDAILEVAFAFARQFFDYLAFFVVHDRDAEGLDAVGPGAGFEEVRQTSVPLDEPGVFATVREGAVPLVTHLDQTDSDRRLRATLRREGAMPAVVVPIHIRSRVVLLMLGDRSGDDFGLADIPELLALAPRVADAFQRLILRRKFRGYVEGDAPRREAAEAPEPKARPRTLRPPAAGGGETEAAGPAGASSDDGSAPGGRGGDTPQADVPDEAPNATPERDAIPLVTKSVVGREATPSPDARWEATVDAPEGASSAAAPTAAAPPTSDARAAVDDDAAAVGEGGAETDAAAVGEGGAETDATAEHVGDDAEAEAGAADDAGADVVGVRDAEAAASSAQESAEPRPQPPAAPSAAAASPSDASLSKAFRTRSMDVLGVPRSAPPPPKPGSQPAIVVGAAAAPALEPAAPNDAAPTEPSGDADLDDDEPEIEIQEASEDDPDFADADLDGESGTGHYSYSGEVDEVRVRPRAVVDVVHLPA